MNEIIGMSTDEIIGAANSARFVGTLRDAGAVVRTDMVSGGVCYSITLPRRGKAPIVLRHVEPVAGTEEIGRFGRRLKRAAKRAVKIAKKVAKSKIVKLVAKAGMKLAKALPGPVGTAVRAASAAVEFAAKKIKAKRARGAAVKAQMMKSQSKPVAAKSGKPAGKLVVVRGRKYQVIALGAA